jgi:EAL domain-containing protein (putative c-di-GMP-specific phosphodiesterase class I)
MNPKDLELEITESALVDDMEHMIKLLAEFHTLGISISIDDFGPGYSNLSKLTSLPLDVLKVDKSFIDALVKDPRSRSITRLIIQMAQSLGLKVIAEGVETEDQFSLLQEWGCSHIQGYLFPRLLPATEFRTLVVHGLQTVDQLDSEPSHRLLYQRGDLFPGAIFSPVKHFPKCLAGKCWIPKLRASSSALTQTISLQ